MAGAALWLAIAVIVVAGIWAGVRIETERQRTLRDLIATGRPMDPHDVHGALGRSVRDAGLARLLAMAGALVMAVAVGLGTLGYVIEPTVPGAMLPLFGAATLVACLAIGLAVAAGLAPRHPDVRSSRK